MRTKHEMILVSEFDPIAHWFLKTDEHPWYIPKETRKYLIELSGSTCAVCKKFAEEPHIDHIIPVSKGGCCFLSNLQVLCKTCNLQKSNHSIDPDSYKKGYIIPIHMPSEHMVSGWIWDKIEGDNY